MARFEIPEGWVAQGYRYALDLTPSQERACRSHAGAARKAHNTMLALVKAVMGQRAAERTYGIGHGMPPSRPWSSAPRARRAGLAMSAPGSPSSGSMSV